MRAALLISSAIAAIYFILRVVSSRRLATVSLIVLGLGYALMVGGSDQIGYAVAPPLLAALIAGALAWRRRRIAPSEQTSRSDTERSVALLAMVLAVGVGVAVVLPEPRIEVSAAGVALLQIYLCVILFGLVPLAAAGLLDTRGTAEWFIAIRYLMAKRRQTFISIITGICVIGIATGVWLIITVLSVMNGFERTWHPILLGFLTSRV